MYVLYVFCYHMYVELLNSVVVGGTFVAGSVLCPVQVGGSSESTVEV